MSIPANKRILVTGANSFLAKELIETLKKNNNVTGVYHKNSDKLLADIVNVPIEKLDALSDDFDLVFIISAYIPPKGEPVNGQLLEAVNVQLVQRICDKFAKAKIILTSSVSVYGEPGEMVNELSPENPSTLYGISKLKGEQIVRSHHQYAVVRISSMYGASMNEQTFVPAIIRSALEKKQVTLAGNGTRKQNYIHVKDVAKIVALAAGQSVNNVYLAVAEKSVSNHEMALFIQQQLLDIKIVMQGADESVSFYYDAVATYKMLDFKPQKNIQEGISELIKWQQKKF